MEHTWTPFTEDTVICAQCGNTCDEAAPRDEWERDDCVPDELLSGGV